MNKHLCKSWLVVTSLLFLSHACGCAGHGSEIGEGGKLAGTTPKEGSHNNIEYKELEVEVRPPDGEVWIAYDAVAPSGLTTAVVSSHYRVCDSDLWQADVSKQEEVLATFESTTILDIDVKNGVVGINHPETENRISSGNLSVVAKVWSEGLGETGRSVLALSQVDTHWREDSASVGDARVHVILQVRPVEAD